MSGLLRRLSSRFSRKNKDKKRHKSKTTSFTGFQHRSSRETDTEAETDSGCTPRMTREAFGGPHTFSSPSASSSRRRLSRAWSSISRMASFLSPAARRHRSERRRSKEGRVREHKSRKRMSMSSLLDHFRGNDRSSTVPAKSRDILPLTDDHDTTGRSASLSYSVTGFTSDESMSSDMGSTTSSARKRRWERREKARKMDSLIEKQELGLEDRTLKRSPIEETAIPKSYRSMASDSSSVLPASTSTSNTSCAIADREVKGKKSGGVKITYISCPHRSEASDSETQEVPRTPQGKAIATMDRYKSPFPTKTPRALAKLSMPYRRVSSPLPQTSNTTRPKLTGHILAKQISVDDSVLQDHNVTTPLRIASDRCRKLRRVRSLDDISHYQRYYDFLCHRGSGSHEQDILQSFTNQLRIFQEELTNAMSGMPSPRILEKNFDMSLCPTPHSSDFSDFCLSYMEQKYPEVFSSCSRLDDLEMGDHDESWTTSYLETSFDDHDRSLSSVGFPRPFSPIVPFQAQPRLDDSWASSSTIVNDSAVSQSTTQWSVDLSPSPIVPATISDTDMRARVNGLYAPKPYRCENSQKPYFAPVVSPTGCQGAFQFPRESYLAARNDLRSIDEVDTVTNEENFSSKLSVELSYNQEKNSLASITPECTKGNSSRRRLVRKYFPDIEEEK